jgi:hypothetical protein
MMARGGVPGLAAEQGTCNVLNIHPTRFRPIVVIAPLLAAVLPGLSIVCGCTSEDANLVGVGLGDAAIDSSMLTLTIDAITSVDVLDIIDQSTPFEGADVLYLGSTEAGDVSSILANYDFSVFDHPDSAYLLPYLTSAYVDSVEILLYMLQWYEQYRNNPSLNPNDPAYDPQVKPWPGAQKYYDVKALEGPFNPQAFPGVPALATPPVELNRSNPLAPNRGTIKLSLQVGPFLEWIAERRQIGVVISEGHGPAGPQLEPSEPGVLGFASKDMRFAGSMLPPLGAGTVLGPALRLKLLDVPEDWNRGGDWLVLTPAQDISSWQELEDPYTDAQDGIMVRTHLRSYPVLGFDLSILPSHVRINRANLVVVNDIERSLGHKTVLTCSEIPGTFAPTGRTSIDLTDLVPAVSLLFGNASWEPEHLTDHVLAFNVTTSLQRFVNGAYEGERKFLLAAGESVFPGWSSTPKPDFWFTKWVFHGSSAAPELRPRLEVSYTLLDDKSVSKEP